MCSDLTNCGGCAASMDFEIINKSLIVLQKGAPVFSESSTTIEIVDEAAGAFVEIVQSEEGKIRITSEEWPVIKKAINKMLLICDKLNHLNT